MFVVRVQSNCLQSTHTAHDILLPHNIDSAAKYIVSTNSKLRIFIHIPYMILSDVSYYLQLLNRVETYAQ